MKKMINIDGMKCMHCVAAVENAIGELSGVTDFAVNLDGGCAEVEFDESNISTEDIIAAIEDQGFGAELA